MPPLPWPWELASGAAVTGTRPRAGASSGTAAWTTGGSAAWAAPARVAFAPALTVTALSALVARTWATCACIVSAPITSSRIASRRAALAASGIPVPAACASGVARPAIAAFSAAVSIGTASATPGAFPAAIAIATAASTAIAATSSTAVATAASTAVATASSTAVATAASTAVATATSTAIAAGAVTALGEGCPIEDGHAGAMAEVKLNPKGKSSSGACYRNEDMSPPTCHDHLMTASNARLRKLQRGGVMNRGRLVGAQHGTLKMQTPTNPR